MRHRHEETHAPKRLRRGHRRWLYALGIGLWGSGAGWLVAHHLLKSPGADSGLPAPSEIWWLRAHGAAVIGFLVVLGTLLPGHVPQGWRYRLNRTSGTTLLATCAVLAVTGYGLYYLSSDTWRADASAIHWIIGLATAPVLAIHAVAGRRIARSWRHPRRRITG